MTIRNLDAETAAAVKRHAAQAGRTLAEELRFLADSAGIAGEAAANDAAQPEPKRKLTVAEKLAIVDRAHAMQTRVLPCSAPLIRQLRKEQAERINKWVDANPIARMTDEDVRVMRAARAARIRAVRARKRQ